MKNTVGYFVISLFSIIVFPFTLFAETEPLALKQSETLRYALLVNDYFMKTYPDVGAKSYVGNKERSSKIWTRGVYYEGLMALYRQYPMDACLKYAEDWGDFHKWKASESKQERHADFQCCGQAYLDMYMLKPDQAERKTHIKKLMDDMLATTKVDDWNWVDAIQMAMPIFAQLGTIEKDERYFQRMYEMYKYTRNEHGGDKAGGGLPLFNESDGLWYRDYKYDPPYMDLKETDKPCYWSRGNGWVYAALARVLYYSPDTVVHREQYIRDFVKMSEALLNCQREDGFWGVSLAAPSNTGHEDSLGPETSGTALFIAGMAYGIHAGIIDKDTYLPCVIKGWNAMCKEAVREDGFLGFVQGAGACPEDGQPVQFNKAADFEDFGIGCFLLAAAEVYQLGDVDLNISSIENSGTGGVSASIVCQVVDGQLQVKLSLQQQLLVSLSLYNINGGLVRKLSDGILSEGDYNFSMLSRGMSGCYICVLKTPLGIQTKKIVL